MLLHSESFLITLFLRVIRYLKVREFSQKSRFLLLHENFVEQAHTTDAMFVSKFPQKYTWFTRVLFFSNSLPFSVVTFHRFKFHILFFIKNNLQFRGMYQDTPLRKYAVI